VTATAVILDADATITDGAVAEVITFGYPANGDEVLVLMLAGQTDGFRSVLFDGVARDALEFHDTAGASECYANVYSLRAGDEAVAVESVLPASNEVLCWAMIDGTNLVPTDWDLFSHSVASTNAPTTGAWTALDTGIILGVGLIIAASVSIGAPTGWTSIGNAATAALSYRFADGTIAAPGAQSASNFTGAAPSPRNAQVYWFGAYDIGRRIRDGGSWWSSGGLAQTAPGPTEPSARQFPPEPAIPNLPPPPYPIVLPLPPWVPPAGGGPYRPR
jgi:hypothetical protein